MGCRWIYLTFHVYLKFYICYHIGGCPLFTLRAFIFSGIPQEILEDSKFVPINNDDPRFGPPVSKSPLSLPFKRPNVQQFFNPHPLTILCEVMLIVNVHTPMVFGFSSLCPCGPLFLFCESWQLELPAWGRWLSNSNGATVNILRLPIWCAKVVSI